MDLNDALNGPVIDGPQDVEIARITFDSRDVRRGDLFVAIRGSAVDGHRFVSQAVERGAVAVVTDTPVASPGATNVVVSDTSKALAELASRFFEDPADRLFLCGITGTNGKTSTAYMYRSIVEVSGWGAMGIVGTLGHGSGDDLEKTPHTTPDPVGLHGQFSKMVDRGCRGVVMEVSSHAVRQHRTWGLNFDVGILTNVTHDHLDYHKTIEDYRAAKREYCDSLTAAEPPGTLVYSSDDPVAGEIGKRHVGDKVSVGQGDKPGKHDDRRVQVRDVAVALDGTSFTLVFDGESETRIKMKLLGSFCAINAALAAAAAAVTGIDTRSIKKGLESIERIPGRFETVGGKDKPVVILDYCHTPDSMQQVLQTCRDLNPGRIIVVFGCGGDRDRTKRPAMGRIAQSQSDFVYVTTDNPRNEPVDAIVEEILSGMDRRADDFRVELDRSRAIGDAIAAASAGDVVALLGKGTEECQIVGNDRLPFSDRKEAEGALQAWRAE